MPGQQRPDVGIITCIGVSHIGNLGSQENICKAKLEICNGLPEGAQIGRAQRLNSSH